MLERCHSAHHTLVIEVWRTPLDGFFNFGTPFMNDCTDVRKNGPGEVCRFRDVCIDAFIAFAHAASE
jgi:hypothetical protein